MPSMDFGPLRVGELSRFQYRGGGKAEELVGRGTL